MPRGVFDMSEARSTIERVFINDTDMPHSSLTWEQEVSAEMPDAIAAGDGFTGRRASARLTPRTISHHLPSPFSDAGGHVPTGDSPVTIWASDARGNSHQVFSGLVDRTQDDDGWVSATFIEASDGLNTPLRSPAIATKMPPAYAGQGWRYPAINAMYHAFLAIRAAGYNPVPPAASGVIFDLPCQGATWCEPGAGVLTRCRAQTQDGASPVFQQAPWGFAVSNADMIVVSESTAPVSSLRASMMVSPGHAGRATMEVKWGSKTLGIRAVEDRTISITVDGGTLLTMTADDMRSAVVVEVLARDGVVSARTNTGVEKSASMATRLGTVTQMVINATTAARVAGFQVSTPGLYGGWHASTFKTTATIEWDGYTTGVRVLPSLRDITARELLDRVTKAVLAPAWVDGAGIMRVRSSSIAYAAESIHNLDVRSNLLELSWEESRLQGRKAVTVGYSIYSAQLGRYPSVRVHDGSGFSADEVGTRQETLVSPGAGEEWIQVDTNMVEMGNSPNQQQVDWFNLGRGSAVGAAKEAEVGSRWSNRVFGSANEIKPWVYRLGVMVGEEKLRFEAPTEGVSWSQKGTPSVRLMAHGLIKQDSVSYTHRKEAAPTHWAELSHDMGAYCHDPEVAQKMAIFIASQAFYPKPVLRNLVTAYDPRIEVMERATIHSEELHGFRAQVLIIGVRHDPEADTTTLTARVIAVTRTNLTYADQVRAIPGTYDKLGAAWDDYAHEISDPLAGRE